MKETANIKTRDPFLCMHIILSVNNAVTEDYLVWISVTERQET